MSLKFPNARLYIYALLRDDGLSGADAIAKTACEYRLIPPESINEVKRCANSTACQCLAATKEVLSQVAEQKSLERKDPSISLNEAWSEIEKDGQSYKELANLEPICEPGPGSPNCLKLAPALFDLLLQQIRRYF